MVKFNEREKGFEAKFKHDQDLEFIIRSKRNKILGEWAGKELKIENIDQYVKDVRVSDLEKPGDDDIIEKIFNDFKERNIPINRDDIINKIKDCYIKAKEDINKEK